MAALGDYVDFAPLGILMAIENVTKSISIRACFKSDLERADPQALAAGRARTPKNLTVTTLVFAHGNRR